MAGVAARPLTPERSEKLLATFSLVVATAFEAAVAAAGLRAVLMLLRTTTTGPSAHEQTAATAAMALSSSGMKFQIPPYALR